MMQAMEPAKGKNLYISGDIRDGSDHRLWISLILSKIEQREQKKDVAYCDYKTEKLFSTDIWMMFEKKLQ